MEEMHAKQDSDGAIKRGRKFLFTFVALGVIIIAGGLYYEFLNQGVSLPAPMVKNLKNNCIVSPNGKHIACDNAQGSGSSLIYQYILDGQAQNQYDYAGVPEFSPDSNHFAYVAEKNKKWFVVVDGKESGNKYDAIDQLVWSPDNSTLVYVATEGTKQVLVNGTTTSQEYDTIYTVNGEGIVFSPDGERLAYVAMDETNNYVHYYVVLDGKENGPYSKVPQNLMFSPDSNHFAYFATTSSTQAVFLDGQALNPSAGLNSPNLMSVPLAFSPDSKNFVYAGEINDKYSIVENGQASGQSYDAITGIYFSPDGTKLVYVAQSAGSNFLVINGVEQAEKYPLSPGGNGNSIGSIIFSPDSQHVAYSVEYTTGESIDSYTYACGIDVDGKQIGYYWVPCFVTPADAFFNNNDKLVYDMTNTWGSAGLYIDGKSVSTYNSIVSGLQYNSTNNSVSYTSQNGSSQYFVTQSL
jgi:hypothetical protein